MHLLILILMMVLTMALTGCGSKKAKEPKPELLVPEVVSGEIEPEEVEKAISEAAMDDGSDPEEAMRAAENMMSANNGRRVVYLILESESPIFTEEKNSLSKKLTGAGYGVTVRYHHNDPASQRAYFEEAVTCEAKAVVCDNLPGNDILEIVRGASDAGIGVFLVNEGMSLSGVAKAQVVTDRAALIDDLIERFAAEHRDSTGYLLLKGAGEDSRSVDIMTRVSHRLKDYDQMEELMVQTPLTYAEADTENALREMLTYHPMAGAVFCYNAAQVNVCLRVLEEMGLSGKSIICVNGDRSEIETYLADGRVEASIVRSGAELGERTAETLITFYKSGRDGINERQYVAGKVIFSEDLRTEEATENLPAELPE
ncbi:MAG: substrate-binding domain-containing protein [Lachnospiraceae bacterium]|nr:substrate-binding domain-containing protein [Lachnospiraceae bacterium]